MAAVERDVIPHSWGEYKAVERDSGKDDVIVVMGTIVGGCALKKT